MDKTTLVAELRKQHYSTTQVSKLSASCGASGLHQFLHLKELSDIRMNVEIKCNKHPQTM
jgi:hypothetical protein